MMAAEGKRKQKKNPWINFSIDCQPSVWIFLSQYDWMSLSCVSVLFSSLLNRFGKKFHLAVWTVPTNIGWKEEKFFKLAGFLMKLCRTQVKIDLTIIERASKRHEFYYDLRSSILKPYGVYAYKQKDEDFHREVGRKMYKMNYLYSFLDEWHDAQWVYNKKFLPIIYAKDPGKRYIELMDNKKTIIGRFSQETRENTIHDDDDDDDDRDFKVFTYKEICANQPLLESHLDPCFEITIDNKCSQEETFYEMEGDVISKMILSWLSKVGNRVRFCQEVKRPSRLGERQTLLFCIFHHVSRLPMEFLTMDKDRKNSTTASSLFVAQFVSTKK